MEGTAMAACAASTSVTFCGLPCATYTYQLQDHIADRIPLSASTCIKGTAPNQLGPRTTSTIRSATQAIPTVAGTIVSATIPSTLRKPRRIAVISPDIFAYPGKRARLIGATSSVDGIFATS